MASLREKIKLLIQHQMLKRSVLQKSGELGKPLFCKNARYITIEGESKN